MLASILIVNYNNAPLIKRCIDSVLNQSYQDIEVIIVDDSSTDNSLNEINKFKSKIKILKKKKNKTQIQAFDQIESYITAFNGCSGDVIFFLDSDDFFKKNKISNLMKIYKKNKVNFLFDLPIFFYNKKKFIQSKKKNFILSTWPNFYPQSCISVRKIFFENFLKFIRKKKFKNLTLDIRLSLYAFVTSNLNFLNQYLTFYQQKDKSESSNYKKFSSNWWIRRLEAHNFLNYLNKKFRKKIKLSFDVLLTKIIIKLMKFINV